ncbi:hypothetical protein [Spirosoma aerolatum]|nr:hypothetical protein [Spirosoma aerolatum]
MSIVLFGWLVYLVGIGHRVSKIKKRTHS